MECDCTKNSWRCQPRISTHALTWSATISPRPTNKPPHISTHALTWSATCVFVPGSHFNCGFQLTHSRGVRHSSGFPCSTDISFQLTHSRGVRHPTARKLLTDGNFNSRTHVECDYAIGGDCGSGLDFNSRTHVECDPLISSRWQIAPISTHALTWSATRLRIHRFCCKKFQLTHSRGVRRLNMHLCLNGLPFQLTHSRGVRLLSYEKTIYNIIISTHALTWSATQSLP